MSRSRASCGHNLLTYTEPPLRSEWERDQQAGTDLVVEETPPARFQMNPVALGAIARL